MEQQLQQQDQQQTQQQTKQPQQSQQLQISPLHLQIRPQHVETQQIQQQQPLLWHTRPTNIHLRPLHLQHPPLHHPSHLQHPPPPLLHPPSPMLHQPPPMLHQPPPLLHQPPTLLHQPPPVQHRQPRLLRQPPRVLQQTPPIQLQRRLLLPVNSLERPLQVQAQPLQRQRINVTAPAVPEAEQQPHKPLTLQDYLKNKQQHLRMQNELWEQQHHQQQQLIEQKPQQQQGQQQQGQQQQLQQPEPPVANLRPPLKRQHQQPQQDGQQQQQEDRESLPTLQINNGPQVVLERRRANDNIPVIIYGLPPKHLNSIQEQDLSTAHQVNIVVFSNPYNVVERFVQGQEIPPATPLLRHLQLRLAEVDLMTKEAAKLLVTTIAWVKNVPAFDALALRDRMLLLELAWKDVFIVATLEHSFPQDLRTFLNETRAPPSTGLEAYRSTIVAFGQTEVDSNELTCLRNIALFRGFFANRNINNYVASFLDNQTVENLRDKSVYALSKYTSRAYPRDYLRLTKLMQLIPSIDSVTQETIVELFLRNLIGNTPVDRLVVDLYRWLKLLE